VATVQTAAAEVGQGLITVEQQICRTEVGVQPGGGAPQGHHGRLRRLHLGVPADLRHRGRGQAACEAVRARVLDRAAQLVGRPAQSSGWTG